MSRRILIVDDHAGFRATARRMLESDGFEVVGEAADATEALELIREVRPEVVLLDFQLPGVDGVECAGQIEDLLPEAPDVVLTSSRPRDDLGPVDVGCVSGFIPKDELSAHAIEELVR